ncbi:hypothetical protein D3C86_1313960 [compost metagenome]
MPLQNERAVKATKRQVSRGKGGCGQGSFTTGTGGWGQGSVTTGAGCPPWGDTSFEMGAGSGRGEVEGAWLQPTLKAIAALAAASARWSLVRRMGSYLPWSVHDERFLRVATAAPGRSLSEDGGCSTRAESPAW